VRRFGLSVDDYLDHYDEHLAQPFPGWRAGVGARPWAVCSNKHPRSGGRAGRLGWSPDVALFADSFEAQATGAGVDALGVSAGRSRSWATRHDRACAAQVGCPFVLAGWNPRTGRTGDLGGAPVSGRHPLGPLDERPG